MYDSDLLPPPFPLRVIRPIYLSQSTSPLLYTLPKLFVQSLNQHLSFQPLTPNSSLSPPETYYPKPENLLHSSGTFNNKGSSVLYERVYTTYKL